jgi:hypothetical protein
MSGSPEPIAFNVIHNDGLVRVRVENGTAILTVELIRDVKVIVLAIQRAIGVGATRGTLFTGEIVNEQVGAMHAKRAAAGITWLGGSVTRLDDGPDGPQFRIDWESFPSITE